MNSKSNTKTKPQRLNDYQRYQIFQWLESRRDEVPLTTIPDLIEWITKDLGFCESDQTLRNRITTMGLTYKMCRGRSSGTLVGRKSNPQILALAILRLVEAYGIDERQFPEMELVKGISGNTDAKTLDQLWLQYLQKTRS